MIKLNITLDMVEVDLIVSALYSKHTHESRRLARKITAMREEHKQMFGVTTQSDLWAQRSERNPAS